MNWRAEEPMKGDRLKSVGIEFPIMGTFSDKFWKLPGKERALLVAAYFADKVRVREVGGNNRGPWIGRMLAKTGLSQGYAWCAAFVGYCCWLAEFDAGPKSGRAAVRNWAKWAKTDNRLGFKPERGDLMYWLNKNQTGHIGFVVDVEGEWVTTIEGNTNGQGSREGDGVYRQKRKISDVRFIRP